MSNELNDYLKERLSHLTIALAPENATVKNQKKLTKPFADGICMTIAYEATSKPDKKDLEATEEMLKATPPDTIFDIALTNTINRHPNVACMSMLEFVETINAGRKPETHPYNGEYIKNVLSNITENIDSILNAIVINHAQIPLGARIIAYPGMMKMLEENIKAPFVISFLSIHEVLIQPYDNKETLSMILTTVKETTKHVDKDKDFLSDNVYEIKDGKLIRLELTKEETANG